MTDLSSLRFKLIGSVKRDPVFPHYVVVFDVFGNRLMHFIPDSGDVWAGDGNKFTDDVTSVAPHKEYP